jgi:hypothetical protein
MKIVRREILKEQTQFMKSILCVKITNITIDHNSEITSENVQESCKIGYYANSCVIMDL